MLDGLDGRFDLPFGRTPVLACCRCKKPAAEVGELRVYPPLMRPVVEVSDMIFPGALRYCGSCAVYKAVEDTRAAKGETPKTPPRPHGPVARGSSAIN